jgi:outer membrane protein assembly factor BamB
VADGKVFYGSRDGNVRAVDENTGTGLWKFPTGTGAGALFYGVTSSPSWYNGSVYFGACDGKVYCVNGSTGAGVWSSSLNAQVFSSPTVADGRVYIGSGYLPGEKGNVYCLDASTGHPVWTTPIGIPVSSSATVYNGTVYIGSGPDASDSPGRLLCIDALTGALLPRYFECGRGIFSCPAVWNDSILFGSTDSTVYCVRAQDMGLKWKFKTGSPVWSSVSVAGGSAFVGSLDKNEYCLDAGTGTLIWNFSAGGDIYSSAAVSNSQVFFGSVDGYVYCINRTTGAFNWSQNTKHPGDSYNQYGISSSPALADGKLFMTTTYRRLYCFGEGSASKFTAEILAPASVISGAYAPIMVWVNESGAPLGGVSVSVVPTIGTVSPVNVTTPANGTLVVNFTAPSVGLPQDSIILFSFSEDGYITVYSSITITVIPEGLPELVLYVTSSARALPSGSKTHIAITVSSNNQPVQNATVELSAGAGSLSTMTATTDADGQCTVDYTAPILISGVDCNIKITARKSGYSSGQATLELPVDGISTYILIFLLIVANLAIFAGIIRSFMKKRRDTLTTK